MNKNIIHLILFILFPYSIMGQESVIQVNSAKFMELIKQGGGILIDVRTDAEFENQHLAQSNFLDFYRKDIGNQLLTLPHGYKILLYCNSGYRSNIAAQFLVKNGYKQVYNLKYGIIEWNNMKYPTVQGNSKLLRQENIYSIRQFSELINDSLPVFVDFYAEWCAPCKKMMPLVDSLKIQYHDKIKVVKVNSDLSKELMQDLKIRGVPFFVLYKNKNVKFSKYGILQRYEIEQILDQNL